MRNGQPSQTARIAAAHRAIHQILEGGAIFKDPFASAILDERTAISLSEMATDASLAPMRLFIVARSRFSEDALAASVARGVRQIVILGAGLDTFCLRNPFADVGVRVFEVDYPATQAWKRERLEQAGLPLPATLTFVPIDFEVESLAGGLANAGFRSDCPAFFQWLGVAVYLSREAILATLDVISSIPASAVVFEYSEPFENHSPEGRARLMAAAGGAAARGEPWLSFFNPAELSSILRGKGFTDVEDLRVAEMVKRYPSVLGASLSISPGGHVVRAERTG